MKPSEITRKQSQKTADEAHYILAYSAGWNAAAEGDVLGHGLAVGLHGDAGFIDGVAAYKGQAATAQKSFEHGSPAHINRLLESRS